MEQPMLREAMMVRVVLLLGQPKLREQMIERVSMLGQPELISFQMSRMPLIPLNLMTDRNATVSVMISVLRPSMSQCLCVFLNLRATQ